MRFGALLLVIIALGIAQGTAIPSCMKLTYAAEYSLDAGLKSNGNCLVIESPNSIIDCGGQGIEGNGSGHGIIVNASNVTVANCRVSGYNTGIEVANSPQSTVKNVHLYNNENSLYVENKGVVPFLLNASGIVFDNPQGDFKAYTNVSIFDAVDGNSAYMVGWSKSPPAYPPGTVSFANKFIAVMAASENVALEGITWHWNDDEVLRGGHDESAFELWQLKSEGWENINNDSSSTESIAFPGKSLSVFGILERLPIPEQKPPAPPKEPGRILTLVDKIICPNIVRATAFENKTPVSDAIARVIQVRPYAGEIFSRLTDGRGNAEFVLPGYADYVIEMTKPGYAKTIRTVKIESDSCDIEEEPRAGDAASYAALKVINSVSNDIDEAERRGSVTFEARQKLAYAVDAYSNENYLQAANLAYEARDSIPPREEYFYIVAAITLFVLLEVYLHIRKKNGEKGEKGKGAVKAAKNAQAPAKSIGKMAGNARGKALAKKAAKKPVKKSVKKNPAQA